MNNVLLIKNIVFKNNVSFLFLFIVKMSDIVDKFIKIVIDGNFRHDTLYVVFKKLLHNYQEDADLSTLEWEQLIEKAKDSKVSNWIKDIQLAKSVHIKKEEDVKMGQLSYMNVEENLKLEENLESKIEESNFEKDIVEPKFKIEKKEHVNKRKRVTETDMGNHKIKTRKIKMSEKRNTLIISAAKCREILDKIVNTKNELISENAKTKLSALLQTFYTGKGNNNLDFSLVPKIIDNLVICDENRELNAKRIKALSLFIKTILIANLDNCLENREFLKDILKLCGTSVY